MREFANLSYEDIGDHWTSEEGDFTPWLADHIDYLEQVTGLNLEVVDTERDVGRYRLDILARDPESSREVVIENQLNASNHDHLGKSIAVLPVSMPTSSSGSRPNFTMNTSMQSSG